MKKSKAIYIQLFRTYFLVLLSFLISVYCACNTICEGLELLFLLPLAHGISAMIFPRAYSYWKSNIGFIILFFSIWIKYLVTPFLMTISHSSVDTLHPTVDSFRLSSIIAVFELFVTLIIVQRVWGKHLISKKDFIINTNENDSIEYSSFTLSWSGFAFIAALLAIVIMRGHLISVFSHLSTWFTQTFNESDLFSYDLIAFDIIKTGIVLLAISVFAKKYYSRNNSFTKNIYFILALVVAVANTYFFQYDQRTALIQLILATLFMFLSFFPDKKRLVIPFALCFGIGLVIITFLEGSLHFTVGDSISDSFIAELSKMCELYVSGPTVVAKTIDTIQTVRQNISIDIILSDIIHSFNFLSMLPFTRWISYSVNKYYTTNELFKQSIGGYAYILPNYTLSAYYMSEFFGLFLETIFIWISVKLICYVDNIKIQHNDALYFYAITYFEIILGQSVFVNNFRLLWHAFSNLPFWLLIFALVNSLGNRIILNRKN